jgi:hypothetical protein
VCDSECKAHSEAWEAWRSRQQIEATNDAFNFLYDGLREAKLRFETGNDGGRDGVVHALETMLKFLYLYEPVQSGGLQAPLAMLFNALMNLDDGAVHPMLQKVPRRGRTRASAGRESLIGTVAFTVDALCDTGKPLDDAREIVARELRRAGVRPDRGGGEFTSRTVRAWCERVAADVGGHGEAKQMFESLKREFVPAENVESERIRHVLLDALRHLIGGTREGRKAT